MKIEDFNQLKCFEIYLDDLKSFKIVKMIKNPSKQHNLIINSNQYEQYNEFKRLKELIISLK